MNANNEFDRLVKDKLAQGQPSVPKDAKEDIERMLVKQGLIKKDDHRRKYFFVVFSVIGFLAILTAIMFKFDGSKKDSLAHKFNSSENGATPTTKISKIEKSFVASNAKNKKDESTDIDKPELKSIINSVEKTEAKTIARQIPEVNPKKEVKQATPSSEASDKYNSDEPISLKGTVAGVAIGKTVNLADNNTEDMKKSPNKNLSESENTDFGEETQSDSNTINANNNLEFEETVQAILISDSTTKQINVVNSDSVPKVVAADSSKKDTLSNLNFSLEAFGGIQQTYMQNTGSAGGSQSSTQSGSNSEWVAGLKFTFLYKEHFTIGTGVNYSIHHSEISHDFNTYIYDTSGVISVSFPAHVKTDFNVTEIPVLIGYYFEMKKFAIHLESGVSISMISNANSILVLDDSSQSIDNFSGVSPVKSYSGFVGQLSVLYSISRRFQVFLQPSINIGLTQIFEGMPDRKINVVSGRTGLRMNF